MKYIGVGWSPEFDCWDFTKEILLNELGIDASTSFDLALSPLVIDDAGKAIESGIREGLSKSWVELSHPLPLSICVMGRSKTLHHIGVVVDENHIVHSNKGMPACCSEIRELRGKYKTIKFYQYAKDNPG